MKKTYGIIGIVIFIIIGLFWYNSRPAEFDEFTQCITNKGAKFYGAYWCTHCQNQKKLFGRAARGLPYIECSTPNGNGQLQICKDKKIDSYPTWEFKDGTRVQGEMTLQKLSEKTECKLPSAK